MRPVGFRCRLADSASGQRAHPRGDGEEARPRPLQARRHRGPAREHFGRLGASGARPGDSRRPHPARSQGDAPRRRRRIHLGRDAGGDVMKFAMVFPGQGSQSVGMLAAYGDAPVVRETLAEASEILKQDLGRLIAEGPAEELNSTVNTQPAMVTAGICAWRLWRDLGGAEPALLAGHSLGEYTALVAAGAISFADCL